MGIKKQLELWKPLITVAVILLCFLAALIVRHHLEPAGRAHPLVVEASQITKGVQEINKLSNASVSDIESKLETIESEEVAADLEAGNFDAIFSDSVFMGDSQAEGFSAFRLLSAARVAAVKGHGLTSYSEDLAKAAALNPKYVFINYGMNNMGTYNTDTDRFITDYKKVVEAVQEKIPDAKIYILNIMPVQQAALTKQPYLGYTKEYNQALEEMCEEMDLTFIDSSSIVKDEYYAPDHIHMGTEMHAEWLKDIAIKSGLLKKFKKST